MAIRKSEALPKPNTVAYLAANVERLTGHGAFTGQPAARTVFLHLCCHPGGNVPHPDKQPAWECRVAAPHHEPAVIAGATGLTVRTAERALDWLSAEGFIGIERGTKTRRSYGPAHIIATSRASDYRRSYGHHVATHPLPPANGHHVAISDTMSLSNGSPTTPGTPKRKRTVAATRNNALNSPDLPSSGALESAGEARNVPVADDPPVNAARECPGPVTRPNTMVREAQVSGEAGPIPIDAIQLPSKRHPSSRNKHRARNSPGADAEVDRVMALLSDLPGWDTATATGSPGRVRGARSATIHKAGPTDSMDDYSIGI